MVPGRLIELGFEALFKKKECLSFIFVDEDSRESKGFLWTQFKHDLLDTHHFSSSSHFLIIDLLGTLPEDFTFPLIMSAGVGRIPY